MKSKIEKKSILFGALFMAIVLITIGASPSQPFVKDIGSVRFLVLEVTPKGEMTGIGQPVVLKLSPHYGKISQEGLDFRFKNETQELSLVTFIENGYEIKRGDILEFQASHHLKLSPGSSITRHLPSGATESVP